MIIESLSSIFLETDMQTTIVLGLGHHPAMRLPQLRDRFVGRGTYKKNPWQEREQKVHWKVLRRKPHRSMFDECCGASVVQNISRLRRRCIKCCIQGILLENSCSVLELKLEADFEWCREILSGETASAQKYADIAAVPRPRPDSRSTYILQPALKSGQIDYGR